MITTQNPDDSPRIRKNALTKRRGSQYEEDTELITPEEETVNPEVTRKIGP